MAHEIPLALRILHIIFAVMWIGGVAYSVGVLRIAAPRIAMPARKEAMRQIIPVAIQYIPGTAVVTIVLGIILYLVIGEFNPDVLVGTPWGQTLLVGLVLALVAFGFGITIVIGAAKKVLTHLEEAECTHGPEFGRLQRIFNRGQFVVLGLGFLIIGLMSYAAHAL